MIHWLLYNLAVGKAFQGNVKKKILKMTDVIEEKT